MLDASHMLLSMQCPQLHVHVTGRRFRDAAWPNVHLGLKGRIPFQPEELQEVRRRLIKGFKDDGEFAIIAEQDVEETDKLITEIGAEAYQD